jgi:hypothetical protein
MPSRTHLSQITGQMLLAQLMRNQPAKIVPHSVKTGTEKA